jgi:hypothetical protein
MQSARYYCHTLMKLEFSRQIFEKYSNIKFHENSSSGTGMIKLIVAFRNFAKAANKR